MKEKEGKAIQLNSGNLLTMIVILCLVFAMGVLCMSKRKSDVDVTIFTREDLERIESLQQMEDEAGSNAEIYAYKDKNGNLMIGWDYSDSKKKSFWKD